MRGARFVLFLVVLALPGLVLPGDEAREPIQLNDDNLVWSDGPPSIPPGAKFVILEGDPKADEEIFTMRVFLPPKFVIPFHWHDGDERATVLEGSVEIGIGATQQEAYITRFMKDGYYVTPSPLRHFVRAGPEGCVLQLTGVGPWTIHYVNPKDDPRGK
jgi:hypothetical protein